MDINRIHFIHLQIYKLEISKSDIVDSYFKTILSNVLRH